MSEVKDNLRSVLEMWAGGGDVRFEINVATQLITLNL